MMRLPLATWIAYRNIIGKKDNLFISFVALVSTFGLVLGVAALITVLSVMNGFEQQMRDKLLGFIPHVQLSSTALIQDWEPVRTQIKHADDNIVSVAPILNTQAMIVSGSSSHSASRAKVLMLNGIVSSDDHNFLLLKQSANDGQGMIAGQLDSLDKHEQNIIIGQTLAEELKVGLGDVVHIMLPRASSSSVIIPTTQSFTVTGIFKLTQQTERYMALTNIRSIAQILEVPIGVQGFRVQLKDVFLAPKTTASLVEYHPEFSAHHWMQTHGTVYESLQLQRNMSGLLLFLIVLVAGFNLVSSLVMTVTEKKSDIAILKTMGATPATIRAIFFWQGLMITLMGTAVGVLFGVSIATYIGEISQWLNHTFELGLFDNYFVTKLPSIIKLSDVVLVVVASIVVGASATVYPAHQAAKIQPALTLHHD